MGNAPVQPAKKQIFADMAENHWARTAVEYLYDLGIINGRTDSEFAPNESITRAEFIKILVCVKNVSLVYGESKFSDVADDAWYAPYVNSAYVNNITSGYDDGTFKPNQKITREDMATMIFRMAGYEEAEETPSFNDAGNISAYAKSAVAVLSQKGIVNGMDGNKFAPKNSATRAQAAQIIYNYLMK
jgi:2',3'-cyclic-nucleotide 2'-phosphodiesterase/3'-nucleotidase/5'-nucleotidase